MKATNECLKAERRLMAIEELNARTWEQMNPDWRDFDGDLTDRFAKSQFDTCPGCGTTDHLSILIVGEDCEVAVGCTECQFRADGDCPSEAIKNWNQRHQG